MAYTEIDVKLAQNLTGTSGGLFFESEDRFLALMVC